MTGENRVSVAEIADARFGRNDVQQRTRSAQLSIALLVMAITAITIAILLKGTSSPAVPQPPNPPVEFTSESVHLYERAVNAYRVGVDASREAYDAQTRRIVQLFQALVVTTLMPALTLVLGYLFATRDEGRPR